MPPASNVPTLAAAVPELSRTLTGTVDQAVAAVTAALKEQGFGVLSDIDVAATLASKLDVNMRPYRILGACAPALAHQAIQVDPNIGLLLPCNVVVHEVKADQVAVSIVDPVKMFAAAPEEMREQLPELAGEARDKLVAAMAALN